MFNSEEIILNYGGPGLMMISFIAATILPFSSEAAVFAMSRLGLPPLEILVWASVGNCLGVTFNYFLGRLGSRKILGDETRRAKSERALKWMEKYGKWSLLLSWLPVVGDPLTIVAGIGRINFLFFAVVCYGVRVARYGVLLALIT